MKKKKALKVLYYVLQWTWGLPQNLLGLAVTLLIRLRDGERIRERFCNAVLTDWKCKGSMGLGMFIFYGHRGRGRETENRIRMHEYGHTIQSVILGPLFLPVIGLPSFLWANLPVFRKLRIRRGIDYFRFYPEAWANKAGDWAGRIGDFDIKEREDRIEHV